jgi:hypothetical protein
VHRLAAPMSKDRRRRYLWRRRVRRRRRGALSAIARHRLLARGLALARAPLGCHCVLGRCRRRERWRSWCRWIDRRAGIAGSVLRPGTCTRFDGWWRRRLMRAAVATIDTNDGFAACTTSVARLPSRGRRRWRDLSRVEGLGVCQSRTAGHAPNRDVGRIQFLQIIIVVIYVRQGALALVCLSTELSIGRAHAV